MEGQEANNHGNSNFYQTLVNLKEYMAESLLSFLCPKEEACFNLNRPYMNDKLGLRQIAQEANLESTGFSSGVVDKLQFVYTHLVLNMAV